MVLAGRWEMDSSGPGWQSWVYELSGPSPIVTPELPVAPYVDVSVMVSGHKGGRVSSWRLEGALTREGPSFAPLSSLSVNAAGGASDDIALGLGSGEITPVIFRVLEPITRLRGVTDGVGDEQTVYVVSVLLQNVARK